MEQIVGILIVRRAAASPWPVSWDPRFFLAQWISIPERNLWLAVAICKQQDRTLIASSNVFWANTMTAYWHLFPAWFQRMLKLTIMPEISKSVPMTPFQRFLMNYVSAIVYLYTAHSVANSWNPLVFLKINIQTIAVYIICMRGTNSGSLMCWISIKKSLDRMQQQQFQRETLEVCL